MSARRTRTRSLCASVGAPGVAPNSAAQVYQIDEILTLAERYASARRMSEATLSYRATRSSTWLERCARGRVTLHSAIAFVQWLCDHWPPGLAWPERIERPESGRNAASVQDPGVERLGSAARLGPDGRIACAAALCAALGIPRSVYHAVVRRYRDEVGAQRWPRAGSESERMLTALSAARDVRFAGRRAAPGHEHDAPGPDRDPPAFDAQSAPARRRGTWRATPHPRAPQHPRARDSETSGANGRQARTPRPDANRWNTKQKQTGTTTGRTSHDALPR